ncbi:MAG: formylglycine-generating enzyme family protein [Deltaproteobacteria bacterium]|nr:formylglycine-generating enzyme family protein [Deltaproteobacteria bacterium]
MKFVSIPAGTFAISADLRRAVNLTDYPERRVTITKPFYLGVYEVTQAQWAAVMGNNPSRFKGDLNPVEMVSWDDAASFVAKLNQTLQEGSYRLPTEAEFERALFAGATAANFWGDKPEDVTRYAWYWENADGETHPVGKKEPNPWGLFDVLGNVDEWVSGWDAENYYAEGPRDDPPGAASGRERISRGCSWGDSGCGSFYRETTYPDERNDNFGLRLVFEPDNRKTKRLRLQR